MGDWDAVLDVSNICRSAELPPKGRSKPGIWARLNLVMEAWRQEYDLNARLYLVADRSLWEDLRGDSVALRQFRELEHSGEMRVVPNADPDILELARDHDLIVLSDDRYVAYRRDHPWIDRQPERFLHWTVVDGQIRFRPSGIKAETWQQVSRKEQEAELDRSTTSPSSATAAASPSPSLDPAGSGSRQTGSTPTGSN